MRERLKILVYHRSVPGIENSHRKSLQNAKKDYVEMRFKIKTLMIGLTKQSNRITKWHSIIFFFNFDLFLVFLFIFFFFFLLFVFFN